MARDFNPGKSESILLSRKHNIPYHPPVLLNQTQIAEVNSHKHLGIIFSNDCSWHEHLELVKTQSMETNQYNAQTQLDRKSLQTIYFSFISPLLEYADVVWNNCTQYESNEFDKIQDEAAKIVTGATKLASIDSLHTKTGWETLGSRRKTHKLTMFYKMKNGLCSSDLQTLHTNSRHYYTSLLPSAVRDWNQLPEQTRNSPSLNIFKNSLKSNLITPPRYYNTGKILGQIYHARLRTACSPLREHLHSKI